jgi:hypothetical protein
VRRATRVLSASLMFSPLTLIAGCSGEAAPSAPTIAVSESASPTTAPGRIFDPTASGTDRVGVVSSWARSRALLTGHDVVAALAEASTTVVDAENESVAMDPPDWGAGFTGPFPSEEVLMDTGVSYVLERLGASRTVTIFVSEYVAHGQGVPAMYAAMEAGEGRRNTLDERYEPAPAGIEAFAYETDGGSGALDRLVVVRTGDAVVVVVANPASPDAPDPDLTGAENLSRAQVDALVRAAVDKLG